MNRQIHDVTTTHLTFKNGIQSHVYVSWLHPFKEQKLVVVGESGMAVFDDGLDWSEKLKIYPHQVDWVDGFPQPKKAEFQVLKIKVQEPLKAECQHFLNCIQNGGKPLTDGEEGVNVLKVLDASQKSLLKGVVVHLDNNKKNKKLFYAHETACIDENCDIGKGTKIWHYSHILNGSIIGENCTMGQNTMIGPDVKLVIIAKFKTMLACTKELHLKTMFFVVHLLFLQT